MGRFVLFLIASILLPLTPDSAIAHASLERAEPRVGNTVSVRPREVTLWFSEKLEPAFSRLTVSGPNGQRVESGKARVNGNQMSISVKADDVGTYQVNWHVLSVDTHTTEGSFNFQIRP
jgi:methionine-rich copper-binding protein CopC